MVKALLLELVLLDDADVSVEPVLVLAEQAAALNRLNADAVPLHCGPTAVSHELLARVRGGSRRIRLSVAGWSAGTVRPSKPDDVRNLT